MGERDTGTRTVGAALSDSASAFSEFVPTVPVDGGHLQVTIGFLDRPGGGHAAGAGMEHRPGEGPSLTSRRGHRIDDQTGAQVVVDREADQVSSILSIMRRR